MDPDIATVAGSDTCPSARNAGELLVGFVRARIDAPRRRIGVLSHAEQRESFIAEDLPICTLRDVARHVVRRGTPVDGSGRRYEEAFDELRRISQSENVKLAVIAQRVLDHAVRHAQARRQS